MSVHNFLGFHCLFFTKMLRLEPLRIARSDRGFFSLSTQTHNNKVLSFVSRCSPLRCESRRFDCILLVFIRRRVRLVTRSVIKHYVLLWLAGFLQLWLVHFHPRCSGGFLSWQLFRCSPVVVFLDRGHLCFGNFNSTIPVDVVRAKSYVNRLFHPACVPMRITINKLYLIPKFILPGVVGVLWNGGCLGTGKSDISVMFLYPVFHRSSSVADVNFAAFIGNSVNNAVLWS